MPTPKTTPASTKTMYASSQLGPVEGQDASLERLQPLPPLRTRIHGTWHGLQGHVCANGKILPEKRALVAKAYQAHAGQGFPFSCH